MRYILLIALMAIGFSCSDSKTDNNSTKDSTNLVGGIDSTQLGNLDLKYKFIKGQKITYLIKTLSSTSQELYSDSSMKQKVNQTVEYKVRLTVNDVDSNKSAKISVLMESIKVDGVINGQHIAYDSKYIQSTQERMMFAQYESLKNKRFMMEIKENGEITKISNVESIVNELISIQNLQKKITKEQKLELKNNFTESALRPLSEQIFRKFPNKKVYKNYSWNEKHNSQFATFQIENVVTFKIGDVEMAKNDSIVVINAGLSINWKGEQNAKDQGMSFYFYDPVVSGDGIVKFNKTTGLISNSNTTTNMEMVTDISGVDPKNVPFKAKRVDITKNTNIVTLVN